MGYQAIFDGLISIYRANHIKIHSICLFLIQAILGGVIKPRALGASVNALNHLGYNPLEHVVYFNFQKMLPRLEPMAALMLVSSFACGFFCCCQNQEGEGVLSYTLSRCHESSNSRPLNYKLRLFFIKLDHVNYHCDCLYIISLVYMYYQFQSNFKFRHFVDLIFD